MCEMRTVTAESHPNLVRLLGKTLPWVRERGYAYVVGYWEDKVDELEAALRPEAILAASAVGPAFPPMVFEFCNDLGVYL